MLYLRRSSTYSVMKKNRTVKVQQIFVCVNTISKQNVSWILKKKFGIGLWCVFCCELLLFIGLCTFLKWFSYFVSHIRVPSIYEYKSYHTGETSIWKVLVLFLSHERFLLVTHWRSEYVSIIISLKVQVSYNWKALWCLLIIVWQLYISLKSND